MASVVGPSVGSPPEHVDALRRAPRLAGTIVVPADKSIAHRALILITLAAGRTTIELRQPGDDVLSTIAALVALGGSLISQRDGDRLQVTVDGLGDGRDPGRLSSGRADCGNSGTTMRLLAGALAAGDGRAVLTGDRSLSARPMERIAKSLRRMGADVATSDGHAPLTISGSRPLRAIDHESAVASAQVLGAIAIAATAADGRTSIRVPGPTRDHSERMLAGLGARVERQMLADGGSLTVVHGPAPLVARPIEVPGDISSAAAWIVAAAIHPDAEIRIGGVGLNPTRIGFIDVLREMGASVEIREASGDQAEPVGEVIVRSGDRLKAVSVGPERVPALIDELPLLAVAMAAAEGTSEVRGATELRAKESDRISTMAAALAATGARVEQLDDGWRIRSGRPRDAQIVTHGDHRVAMALAVAAWTGVSGSTTLDDRDCVAVSYPGFWRDAATLGATHGGAA